MASVPAIPGKTVRQIKPLAKPRNNFERVAWILMRYSGLALVFLSLSHFWMQHIIVGTHQIMSADTARRWGIIGQLPSLENVIWRLYYAVILGLAMLHGLNGLRQVVGDYFRSTAYKAIMVAAVVLIGFVAIWGFVALYAGAKLITK